ncbi:MAG: hypothetical protein ABWZ68_03705 [Acidimicrobiales bacterium]
MKVDGRHLEVRLDKTVPGERDERRLERVLERTLTSPDRGT